MDIVDIMDIVDVVDIVDVGGIWVGANPPQIDPRKRCMFGPGMGSFSEKHERMRGVYLRAGWGHLRVLWTLLTLRTLYILWILQTLWILWIL